MSEPVPKLNLDVFTDAMAEMLLAAIRLAYPSSDAAAHRTMAQLTARRIAERLRLR